MEFYSFAHQSKALDLLYKWPFESISISWSVWPQMTRKVAETPKDGADSRRFREFAVCRFVRSRHTQKQNCRAFQKLSIGIHLFKIQQITRHQMKWMNLFMNMQMTQQAKKGRKWQTFHFLGQNDFDTSSQEDHISTALNAGLLTGISSARLKRLLVKKNFEKIVLTENQENCL